MPEEPSARLRLTRAMRMKQSREFGRVRERGQRAARGCMIANWQSLPQGSCSKLGVVTSKRIGKAVARSRARRLLREAYRLHQHHLAGPLALVLVARNSIVGKKLADVEGDFLFLMQKASLLKLQ